MVKKLGCQVYDHSVFITTSAFIPLVVETLGLCTDISIFLWCCITACTTPHYEFVRISELSDKMHYSAS